MLPVTILGRPATERDVHEFLGFKKRRGEPVNVEVNVGAQASGVVFSRPELERLRGALRENPSFARASERLDDMEHALRKRRGVPFPLPVELKQGADGTLGLVWRGITAAANVDGIVSIVVGADGKEDHCVGPNPEVLDALAALAARS